jgi:LSD1 subclass zinc finger protein
VPGVTVFAPQPEHKDYNQAVSYACPNCGANIAFDVSTGGIACEYCGYIAPVSATRVGRSADNFEFTLETLSQARRGWGTQRQVLHCDSCGGELSLPSGALTTTCAFCASNQVNVITTPEETLRPRFLIPFKVTPEQTLPLARDWLGKGWYHPNALAENVAVRHFVGIYLPFWTFKARVDAQWQAQVGYQKTERVFNHHNKQWESRTRTVWVWEDGRVNLNVNDLLIPGTAPKRLSHTILKQLYPVHMGDLVAYSPDYLAGWRAQAYETTLTDAWEIGKKAIREDAKLACYQNIRSSQVRNFSMSADFSDESWRYILLPVYLAAYRYDGKVYQVMINGQTGIVAGSKPVAWWKVWLAIAALLAPGGFLTLIGLPLTLLGGVGIFAIALGIILFIIGAIIGFSLYTTARKSEVG